jgi:hypothetical protein
MVLILLELLKIILVSTWILYNIFKKLNILESGE